MGKKTKNTKITNNKNKQTNSLQELQSTISSLSLAEAMRAVKLATETLNKLKEQQKEAEEETIKLKNSIENSSLKKENNDQYADKEFWDKRYQNETTYEWYLSYNQMKLYLLPDLEACSTLTSEILVPGCGNSTLCEDLWNDGIRNICGLDYSSSVVQNMNQRSREKQMISLSYIQADACSLPPSIKLKRFRAIIDKGTLDAIASGGSSTPTNNNNNNNNNSSDPFHFATLYLHKMWEVVQQGGRFILLSTMPSSLFDMLAVNIIPSRDFTVVPLKTPEGGDIYYYTIIKDDTNINKKKSINVTNTNNILNTSDSKINELESIMEEVRQAHLEIENARKKVQDQSILKDFAQSDLIEAENKKEKLSKTLNQGWSDIALDNEVKNIVNSINIQNSTPTSQTSIELYQPPVLKIPKVQLKIRLDDSKIEANGYVVVEYNLKGGEWDEDDFIELHTETFITKHSLSNKDSLHTNSTNSFETELETFEYTTQPIYDSTKNVLSGTVKLQLPSYGGLFHILYQRVVVTILPTVQTPSLTTSSTSSSANKNVNFSIEHENEEEILLTTSSSTTSTTTVEKENEILSQSKSQNAIVLRNNKTLCCSETLNVPFPIIQEEKQVKSRVSKGRGNNINIIQDELNQFNIKCNIPSQYNHLKYFIEDMKNINALVITIIPQSLESSKFSKISSWILKNKNINSINKVLVVECDIITQTIIDNNENNNESENNDLKSKLGLIAIPLFIDNNHELKFNESFGVIDSDSDGNNNNNNNYNNNDGNGNPRQRIVIKIPYNLKNDQSLYEPEIISFYQNSHTNNIDGIKCRCCSNLLVSSYKISKISSLPSGLFDQVMHEYLCSETQPTMPLSISDLKTPSGTIYGNDIFLTISPNDVNSNFSNIIECCCKLRPSLLDVICGSVGAKGLTQVGLTEDSSNALSLVDTSTCLLKCKRCYSILGDGCIADDSTLKRQKDKQNKLEDERIELDDLQDIRLLKSEITWNQSNLSISNIIQTEKNILHFLTLNSIPEQIVTNTFLWLVNRYDLTSFELYVPDWNDIHSRTVIRLKLLSRVFTETNNDNSNNSNNFHTGYAVHLFNDNINKPYLKRAIKVSYKVIRHEDTVKKSPRYIKIPLPFSDYFKILESLEERKLFYGPSFITGDSLSFLYQ